jgi:hypothetical protein
MRFLAVTMPLVVIYTYQLIPARARRYLFGPDASSHMALAAVLMGAGWRAIWHYGRPRIDSAAGLLWAGKSGEKLDWVPTTTLFENKSRDN